MREFARGIRGADSPAFERRLAEHPGGYYVNITGRSRGRLHRATCGHIVPTTPGLNLVTRPKWASDARGELEREAVRRGMELAPCPDCDV